MENEQKQKVSIRNPLASFTLDKPLIHFEPEGNDNGIDGGIVSLLTTVRHPVKDSNDPNSYQSSRSSFQTTFQRDLSYIRAKVLSILLGPSDRYWVCFSNHSATGSKCFPTCMSCRYLLELATPKHTGRPEHAALTQSLHQPRYMPDSTGCACKLGSAQRVGMPWVHAGI